jgi:hypothetical protein
MAETSTDLSDKLGALTPLAPATITAAQRVIASHLNDPAAVVEVLDMLGIGDRQ